MDGAGTCRRACSEHGCHFRAGALGVEAGAAGSHRLEWLQPGVRGLGRTRSLHRKSPPHRCWTGRHMTMVLEDLTRQPHLCKEHGRQVGSWDEPPRLEQRRRGQWRSSDLALLRFWVRVSGEAEGYRGEEPEWFQGGSFRNSHNESCKDRLGLLCLGH